MTEKCSCEQALTLIDAMEKIRFYPVCENSDPDDMADGITAMKNIADDALEKWS